MSGEQLQDTLPKTRLRGLLLGALLTALALAGCDWGGARDGKEAAGGVAGQATAQSAVRTAGGAPDQPGLPDPSAEQDQSEGEAPEKEDEPVRPATVYYDLTRYDWYRRGEPILFEGRRYLPGRVEPTGERRLHREGTYDGVDFYVSGDMAQPLDTIYVPVFNGYWLPFISEAQPAESAN
jgi:hypothetical protein